MNFKELIKPMIKSFPYLKPREMIKLNKYFLEYARELASKNGIDTIKEYKRTSKLIELYNAKWFACFGNIRTILDMYDEIAKTQTQYKDCDTMFNSMVTPEELEELTCFYKLLSQ